MVNALALVLVQLQVAEPVRVSVPPDSVLARAHAAADSFVRNWTYHWQSSQLIQRRMTDAILPPTGVARVQLDPHHADSIGAAWERAVPLAELRHNLFHCHPDGAVAPRGTIVDVRARPGQPPQPTRVEVFDGWRRLEEYIVESGLGKRAICPSWYQGGSVAPWDESTSLDAAIIEPLLPVVRAARQRLLSVLDNAGHALPTDDWIVGQRVRFRIDQQDLAGARKAAEGCTAAAWWCASLRAYVEHLNGNEARADSLFEAGIHAMSPADRCAWTDLSVLLSDDDRARYRRTPCARRDALNATIWWLSDPLYTERGNARRADHYARQVLIRLRTGTQFNERWDFRGIGGGRGPLEMIVRYGWPSFSFWAGPEEDRSHLETYLFAGCKAGLKVLLRYGCQDARAALEQGAAVHDRFATAEYSAPRFHFLPSWSAIDNPWDAQPADWVLTERASTVATPRDTLWWPREHSARRAGPVVQLWEQVGAFRRDSAILFAMATELDPAVVGYSRGDAMVGALVFLGGPDSMTTVPQQATVGGVAVFRTEIPSAHRVVGLELRGSDSSGAVARARFGLSPPRSLKAMSRGEIAISQPVFIEPPPAGGLPVTAPDAALSRMLPTTTFSRQVRRVAVYWESYGVSDGDTVDVAVRVERRDASPGPVRSLGIRLGIGTRTDGGFSSLWREPSPGRVVTTLPGRIPVQGRSISFDITRLAPGNYRMLVSVSRSGSGKASAARDFQVLER